MIVDIDLWGWLTGSGNKQDVIGVEDTADAGVFIQTGLIPFQRQDLSFPPAGVEQHFDGIE
ncbi:MAG: hypothetical protein RQ754_06705 [Desulfuromonadales bacterium]|nr:hypothetical protein [Desulfuromonadales bacterium]